ncbi:MAG: hypothetical protein H6840_12450 [Planctomycetes bacterium]|nr:hypothetical protein [Planctomycetota bacterium]
MTRRLPLIAAVLALLLSACGGGNAAPPAPAPSQRQSRLVSFDSAGLAQGLAIPDFTRYWTLAEQRNGNVFPVKARTDDPEVMCLRLDKVGKFGTRAGTGFQEASLTSISAALETLSRAHWNDDIQASSAAVLLFADGGAPWVALLQLCRELVDLRVRNLWLVTSDQRDEVLRLLPLLVDTSQVFKEWYTLEPEEAAPTVHFARGPQGVDFGWFDGKGERFSGGSDWRAALEQELTKFAKRAQRVQFHLPDESTMAEFAADANLLAPLGYAAIEPFWPALDRPESSAPTEPRRELAVFKDTLELTSNLNVPTLSDYWRASAADHGLAAAGAVDETAPLLAVRVTADGGFASRTRDAPTWSQHADDLGLLEALQRNAGEIDFDTGLSELQILLCMDRAAAWETFLGVLEILKSVRCHRLLVVTNDVVGPTLRLLNLNLPLDALDPGMNVAAVRIERTGPVADGLYKATMTLDKTERQASGVNYPSSLAHWVTERKAEPDVLLLQLPRDEPFETLFTVLNSLAWLGMHGIRFGG